MNAASGVLWCNMDVRSGQQMLHLSIQLSRACMFVAAGWMHCACAVVCVSCGFFGAATLQRALGSPAGDSQITGYSVKPSTSEDIAAAEFVICHGGSSPLCLSTGPRRSACLFIFLSDRAGWPIVLHTGAGSIFDVVRANTPLIVVPNTSLMGNHQMELVKAMKEASHMYVECRLNWHVFGVDACGCAATNSAATTPEGLPSLLKSVDFTALVPVPPPNGDLFRKRVDVAMGLA